MDTSHKGTPTTSIGNVASDTVVSGGSAVINVNKDAVTTNNYYNDVTAIAAAIVAAAAVNTNPNAAARFVSALVFFFCPCFCSLLKCCSP